MGIQPPYNDGKFAAYGGPDLSIDTEMKCRVVNVTGDVLWVTPYPNYEYLLLEGNRRRPVPGEDGYAERFKPLVLDQTGEPTPPIMKLETYQVGNRPPPAGIAGPPKVIDDGTVRLVRPGDHIKVSGLYVIDYAHPPYWHIQTDSWTYMRGLYKAAFAHAEIHPYNYSSVELLPRTPGPEQYSEIHTVAAPIYTQSYSRTYFANEVGGVAGELVDDSKNGYIRVSSVFIPAPPRPVGPRWELRLERSEEVKAGPGNASGIAGRVTNEGIEVALAAVGSDVRNPTVYRARYTVKWVEASPRLWAYSSPYPPPLGRPIEVTIKARDFHTREPVGGTGSLHNPRESGHSFTTDTPFTFTFHRRRRVIGDPLQSTEQTGTPVQESRPRRDGNGEPPQYDYPSGRVTASGYETSSIDFGWQDLERQVSPQEQEPVTNVGIETLRSVQEQGDAELAIRLYADDAELHIVGRDSGPSSPGILRGSGDIGEYLRAHYRRGVSRHVDNEVIGEDRIALFVTCEYPDGTKALIAENYELRDGRIIRQVNLEVRDEL